MAAGFGYRDVMDMPWTLARDFAAACAHIARDALLDAAMAARVAQADAKGWEQWVRAVESGRG